MPIKQALESCSRLLGLARATLLARGRISGIRPAEEENRSEPRWLSHGQVELYFMAHGQLTEATANLVDKSESGVRLWTSTSVKPGDCFLLMDDAGNEGEAVTAWTKLDSGGTLLGARVTWVGAVLNRPPSTALAAVLQSEATVGASEK